MGHRPLTELEAQAAGIKAEEKWVNAHAPAVDRLVNSREYKLGTLTYTETGGVPHDRFWSGLTRQEEKNPAEFLLKHPSYAGFYTAPAKLGELPANNVIFDVMKDRDELNHAHFAQYHPFYVALVDRDLALEKAVTPTTPVTTPVTGVPVPAGEGLTSGGSASPGGSSSTGGSGLGPPGNLSAPSAVPEPASGFMLAAGLVVALMARRLIGGRAG